MRAAALSLAVLFLLVVLAGCGASEATLGGHRPVIRSLDSSWIPGQLSLSELAAYQAISEPALRLAQQRAQQRKRELALLEARRIAARKRERDDARRRYQEALRRAREKYRLALKKAARERALAEARHRRLKAEYERKRREAEERLRVRPGEECRDPVQRRRYRCSTGRIPVIPR